MRSVTAIVPTHNRRELLLKALESIFLQTRPPEQIIVVSDGSTDGSPDAVRAIGDDRIEVLDMPKAPRLGWGHRNEALRRARGDLIAWLADDDLWLPHHLERTQEAFEHLEIDLFQGKPVHVQPDGGMVDWGDDWAVAQLRRMFVSGTQQQTPMAAIVHRAGLAEDVGGWIPDPVGDGDADLWRRMLEAGARTTMSAEPTLLAFPARVGERPNQVQQSGRFLERMSDPAELVRLKAELARGLRASVAGEIARRDREIALRDREVAWRDREIARRDQQIARRDHEIASRDHELAHLRERDDMLERILNGGWWRLRGYVAPVLRVLARARRRPAA
jgi:glycosyltransferase involved in cell wall biosynthesis